MPLQLTTPKQADTLTTAAKHQIDSLVLATRRVLDAADISYTQNESSADNRRKDTTAGDMITIHIDTTKPALATGLLSSTLTLAPRFPGSLAAQDITFSGCSLAQEKTDTVIQAIAEADHYGSFAPLPESLNAAAGLGMTTGERSDETAQHALAFISAEGGDAAATESLEQSTDPIAHWKDIGELCSVIDQLGTVSSMTLLAGTDLEGHETRSTGQIQRQLQLIAKAVQRETGVFVHTLSNNVVGDELLLPLISKFDFVLFAGCPTYADAVNLGVPVYTWRLHDAVSPPGEWLEKTAQVYWSARKIAVNQQQREWLSEQRAEGKTINNTMCQFDQLIGQFLTAHAIGNTPVDSSVANKSSVTPVISANTQIYPGSQQNQNRQALGNAKRKWLKFGQSPARFIRDSDHTLIKKLQPFLRDPAA